jgi:hypothetical protein
VVLHGGPEERGVTVVGRDLGRGDQAWESIGLRWEPVVTWRGARDLGPRLMAEPHEEPFDLGIALGGVPGGQDVDRLERRSLLGEAAGLRLSLLTGHGWRSHGA